jgi:hypothetical protein
MRFYPVKVNILPTFIYDSIFFLANIIAVANDGYVGCLPHGVRALASSIW